VPEMNVYLPKGWGSVGKKDDYRGVSDREQRLGFIICILFVSAVIIKEFFINVSTAIIYLILLSSGVALGVIFEKIKRGDS